MLAIATYVEAPLYNPSSPYSAKIPIHAMAVDGSGNVYIQQTRLQDDHSNHTIKVYSSAGNSVNTFVLDEFTGDMTLTIHGSTLYAGGGNYYTSISGIMSFDLNGNYIKTNLYPNGGIRQLDSNSSGLIAASHKTGNGSVKIYDLAINGYENLAKYFPQLSYKYASIKSSL